jgi:hypothetical protein
MLACVTFTTYRGFIMQKSLLTSSILCSALALTACGGDSNNSSSVQPAPGSGIATATQVIIDATAGGSGVDANDPANKYTYFSFSTGAVVELADDEAQASNAWDIAFKRNGIIVNDQTSEAALVAEQADFYGTDGAAVKEIFVNATTDSEAQHFIDITAENITDAEFKADAAEPALGKEWYIYENHAISANTEKFFFIQNAESDNVSIFNVKAITTTGRSAESYTVQFFNNTAVSGEEYAFPAVDAGTEFVATFTDSISEICYDLDTQAQLDCASNEDSWDLRFDASFEIWLNGGIHGTGNAKTTAADSFAAISAMKTVVPSSLNGDSIGGGVFTDSVTKWWEYGINGGHNIWSNYRVYAVKTNEEHYKMRILSYYAPADSVAPTSGTSGVITVEYEKL